MRRQSRRKVIVYRAVITSATSGGSRRRPTVALLGLALAALTTSVALAAQPRGHGATYIAPDAQGRPAISLIANSKTSMMVLLCYRWSRGGDPHEAGVQVRSDGSFSYRGVAIEPISNKQVKVRLHGRFVSRNRAVGHVRAPCMKRRRFTARYQHG
jgi:hypothetical protein